MQLLCTWLRKFLPLCAAAGVASATGTSIDFDRLSINDGLSQSIVEQIVQDRQGFRWFATEDGLNRFDGYAFTVYRNIAGDPASLSHNELKSVFEDRSGVLWVGTFGGDLDLLDPRTGRFTHHRHDPGDSSSISNDFIRMIVEDRSGARSRAFGTIPTTPRA